MTTATYTFDENLFSDLHKDAMGFRPNAAFFTWLTTATEDEKQAEWDSLINAMEAREASRKEDERASIVVFEHNVATTVANGAGDRATAIRWMMEAEGHCNGDTEYFEYLMGVPYGYTKK